MKSRLYSVLGFLLCSFSSLQAAPKSLALDGLSWNKTVLQHYEGILKTRPEVIQFGRPLPTNIKGIKTFDFQNQFSVEVQTRAGTDFGRGTFKIFESHVITHNLRTGALEEASTIQLFKRPSPFKPFEPVLLLMMEGDGRIDSTIFFKPLEEWYSPISDNSHSLFADLYYSPERVVIGKINVVPPDQIYYVTDADGLISHRYARPALPPLMLANEAVIQDDIFHIQRIISEQKMQNDSVLVNFERVYRGKHGKTLRRDLVTHRLALKGIRYESAFSRALACKDTLEQVFLLEPLRLHSH